MITWTIIQQLLPQLNLFMGQLYLCSSIPVSKIELNKEKTCICHLRTVFLLLSMKNKDPPIPTDFVFQTVDKKDEYIVPADGKQWLGTVITKMNGE